MALADGDKQDPTVMMVPEKLAGREVTFHWMRARLWSPPLKPSGKAVG